MPCSVLAILSLASHLSLSLGTCLLFFFRMHTYGHAHVFVGVIVTLVRIREYSSISCRIASTAMASHWPSSSTSTVAYPTLKKGTHAFYSSFSTASSDNIDRVAELANQLVQLLSKTAESYPHKEVLWLWGFDFAFTNAGMQFGAMDKVLISSILVGPSRRPLT